MRAMLLRTFGCLFVCCLVAFAQEEIPLWPNGLPDDGIQHQKEELVQNRDSDQNEFGHNRSYSFVSNPTVTPMLAPADKRNGVAVVIFPGGGYTRVVIDKEGFDIARILNRDGISAFVVKYRTAPAGWREQPRDEQNKILTAILMDAQQAARIVRSRADEWNLDPQKIGAMGFSAGGNLVYRLATHLDDGNPDAADGVARFGCKLNFAAPIYPWIPGTAENINGETPPMFIVVAHDDKTTPAEQSLDLYNKLRANGVAAELHIFTRGGHGFGRGVRGGAVTAWPKLFIEWLQEVNRLSKNGR